MLDKFIEYMKNEGMAQNTYESYVRDVKLFQKYYEDSYGEELETLTHSDISMYKTYLLNKNMVADTINRKLSSLKKYNQFLIEQNIQEDIVIKEKDFIKIQKPMVKKKLPSEKDINRLKHFTSKDEKNPKRDFCFIVLFTYGGFRESELTKLKVTDIRLEERFINVIGKGNKFRQVVINDLMYGALDDYLKERKEMNIKNPYLFIGQKNKNTLKPLNRNFCNRQLNKYKEICKIDGKLYPHLLRDFFCSNALHNAGYTIEQVANQAGHSSLNTTRIYLHTEDEDLLTLSNRL